MRGQAGLVTLMTVLVVVWQLPSVLSPLLLGRAIDAGMIARALEQNRLRPIVVPLFDGPQLRTFAIHLEVGVPAEKVEKIVDALEESDDVQNVYHNAALNDEVRAQLEAE